MLEIALLIAAAAGIAAFARGRGGKPWLWGTLTVVGYFVVPFLIRLSAALRQVRAIRLTCLPLGCPFAQAAISLAL